MSRRTCLIAAILFCASSLPGAARAIPDGIYDFTWTGHVDMFLYNTTGNPGMLGNNTLGNTLNPGQPILAQNVTVCPAGPDGVQLFAGQVTSPATVQPWPYGFSGQSFFVFGFTQFDLIMVLPLVGFIDTDGGGLEDMRTETDLLLDGSEDEIAFNFEGPPAPAGSIVVLQIVKPDPNQNGLDDDGVPRSRESIYSSTGSGIATLTLDPFPSNVVTGSGTPLNPACDPSAMPSTCTATVLLLPATACGTQGLNIINADCSFVEVTNVISRFVMDFVLTRTGDLPPGTCTDVDEDGILDSADNCVNVANGPLGNVSPGAPVQADSDEDYIGNACDCDYDQNGTCGFSDFTEFLNHFGEFCPQTTACNKTPAQIVACDNVDQDRNNTVGFGDFTLFLDGFGAAPGPTNLITGPEPPPGSTQSINCP